MLIWEQTIEDIKVGISDAGMACGPVGGNVIAEVQLRDTDYDEIRFHSMAEVDGTLYFYESDQSLFDILCCDDWTDEMLETVEDNEVSDYMDYEEFFDDLEENEKCDGEHEDIWRLLVYLVRASNDDTEKAIKEYVGKPLNSIDIPASDVEQEYKEEKEAESREFLENEAKLLEEIRADYIGKKIDIENLDLDEGESPEGEYPFEETFQDSDFNEYRYSGSYTLDKDGTIIDIGEATCEMLMSEDAARCTYEEISAEMAYDALRDILDELM